MKSPGDATFQTIGQPAQDAALEQRLTVAVDALLASTPNVVIFASPYLHSERVEKLTPGQQAENDPARMDRVNEIIRKVADGNPRIAVGCPR